MPFCTLKLSERLFSIEVLCFRVYRYGPLNHMSSPKYFYASGVTPTVNLEILGNFGSNAVPETFGD